MAVDPKKLVAMMAKQGAGGFQGGGEEEMPEEDMEGVEAEGGEAEGGGEEEDFIDLHEREIETIGEIVEDDEGNEDLYALAEELAEAIEAAEEEGEEVEQPPKWAASPSIWDRAEKAVDPEGKGSKYTEPYAVVTHVYRRMGGRIK
jgi:hypothetical protein